MRRPDRLAGLVGVGLQKRRQVARDGRIGLERQPDLAETRHPLLAGRSAASQCGKKPSTSKSLTSRRATSTEIVPPISFRPRPRTEIGVRLRPFRAKQRLLGRAARMPQGDRLPGVELHALFGEPAGDVMGQGEVHVVAAHQKMIADGDASQDQFALLFGGADQRQIGRSAADVADQQRIAERKRPPPALAGRGQPGIDGRLRFFEQHQVGRQSGGQRGLACQFAGAGVERGRHGQHHLLLGHRRLGMRRLPRRRPDVPR